MSEFGNFDSVFDASSDDSLLDNDSARRGDGATSSASGDETETETKTIYVSETEGVPPELDEVNKALQDRWYIVDISLGLRKRKGESSRTPCFIVSMERSKPPSLFDFD